MISDCDKNSSPVIVPDELKARLDEAVARINVPGFVADDPVQFPRRFSDLRDIEITALLSAVIAWGRRPMILRDCEKLLELMDFQPYRYVAEGEWEALPERLNIHRTMFASHLKYMLRGLKAVYARHESLDAFAASVSAGESEAPAWRFASALQDVMLGANGGAYCPECIPSQLDNTALKRINMAIRWLVRDDGVVDMGVWHSIPKSKLFIPLDVHVGNTSRALGLLSRRSNDRKAVEELTAALRRYDPSDPCRYDFALFGIGVNGENVL